MEGLGISSVPHLTITSPLVNRSCSSRWNYRRCQSPHRGCRLAPASKLIVRVILPGFHTIRLNSLDQATLINNSNDVDVYFFNETNTPITISSNCVIGSSNIPESHADVIDVNNVMTITALILVLRPLG